MSWHPQCTIISSRSQTTTQSLGRVIMHEIRLPLLLYDKWNVTVSVLFCDPHSIESSGIAPMYKNTYNTYADRKRERHEYTCTYMYNIVYNWSIVHNIIYYDNTPYRIIWIIYVYTCVYICIYIYIYICISIYTYAYIYIYIYVYSHVYETSV